MTSSFYLFIAPTNNEFAELYKSAADAYNRTPMDQRNAGFDLYSDLTDTERVSEHCVLVNQGCRAVVMDGNKTIRAYWLVPRSSICKTAWRVANSLGLIDATYRGVLKAALTDIGSEPATIAPHQRLMQLATPDLLPWESVIIVDELPTPQTLRGEGGFGSTGVGSVRLVVTEPRCCDGSACSEFCNGSVDCSGGKSV